MRKNLTENHIFFSPLFCSSLQSLSFNVTSASGVYDSCFVVFFSSFSNRIIYYVYHFPYIFCSPDSSCMACMWIYVFIYDKLWLIDFYWIENKNKLLLMRRIQIICMISFLPHHHSKPLSSTQVQWSSKMKEFFLLFLIFFR